MDTQKQYIKNNFLDHISVQQHSLERLLPMIDKAARCFINGLKRGGKILCCGNGGSASDAQHFAAELLNRFEAERRELPAYALCADGVTLTAISNDYAYDQIFSKQIRALGDREDILLAISTRGNSPNVLQGVRTALNQNMSVVALTGSTGGPLADLLKGQKQAVTIAVPSDSVARIQETHILIIHCWCGLIDKAFLEEDHP